MTSFLEERIQNSKRRINNIEENPDPRYLRSNKMRYELSLKNDIRLMEAWKAGKPFAWGLGSLGRAMGFYPVPWTGDSARNPQKYLDIAVRKLGFPEHTCDRTMIQAGVMLSGEIPYPRLMQMPRIACDPERFTMMAQAKYMGTLYFDLDKPYRDDYEAIRYGAEQLEEMIEFSEKSIPGIEYNEDKLVELQEMGEKIREMNWRSYELRKREPCPLAAQDAFRLGAGARSENLDEAMEAAQIYLDELCERAEKGISGVREEKLRIAWTATGPYGRETFDLLTRKGVSLVWFHYGSAAIIFGVVRDHYGNDERYDRKLTPLEEHVRNWNYNAWGGVAARWVDPLIKACKELKVDAVVDFMQPGCVTTKNLRRITASRLKEEADIPTLQLEGRQYFTGEAERNEMHRKLEEFLDMCIANKQGSLH